jgi:hypothetical protein
MEEMTEEELIEPGLELLSRYWKLKKEAKAVDEELVAQTVGVIGALLGYAMSRRLERQQEKRSPDGSSASSGRKACR